MHGDGNLVDDILTGPYADPNGGDDLLLEDDLVQGDDTALLI